MKKYLPLREPISAREASDLRTRRARGGLVLLRTLGLRGDAPRGALDTSHAATLKISFHFFASPPQTPPPLGERNWKEIFGCCESLVPRFSLPLYAKFRYSYPAYSVIVLW